MGMHIDIDIDVRTLPSLTPDIEWEEWQPKGQTLIEIAVQERLEAERLAQAALAAGKEPQPDFQI